MQNGGMAQSSTSWGVAARLLFGLGALGAVLGAVAIAQGPGRGTTYVGHSDLAAVLGLGASSALVLAGPIASLSARRIGDLALWAGFLWLAPVWVGWSAGPPLVRSLAMVAAGFLVPVVFHLVLAYPSGRLVSTAGRVLVAATYIGAALVAVGRALFRDPFFDLNCWGNCTDNVFLLRSLPRSADAIDFSDRWFVAAAAVAFTTICLWRLVKHPGTASRNLLPVVVPAVIFAGAVVAHSIAIEREALEGPTVSVFYSIFVTTSTALALLAAGLMWGFLRTRLQRRAVDQIVATLGEAPSVGTLESALGEALGDPDLRISYWLPDPGRFVDANGKAVPEPVATGGRAATTLVRDNHPVAVMSHAAGLSGIEAEMGPAVRLALENERLQAQALAQLEDLRESRARIVETGDAERRRLERDLHDGAQQQLLAVSYDIRLARSDADAGDVATASLLTTAVDEAQVVLDDLRELAHGIYPAVLGEAGLSVALASFADTAPLPLEIHDTLKEPYASTVETTTYLLVVDAVDDAAGRGATHADVTITSADGQLVVVVQDDGSDRAAAMTRATDRVGALGGTIELAPTTLRAEIPCE